MRVVPVDQRVWSDAPAKSAVGGLVFDRVGLTTKDFSDKHQLLSGSAVKQSRCTTSELKRRVIIAGRNVTENTPTQILVESLQAIQNEVEELEANRFHVGG